MSMTREEAIKTFEEILQLSPTLDETGCFVTEAMKAALTALRGPTREMVERMRSKWIPLNSTQEHFCENCGVSFNLYSYCKNDYNFCPFCGAPMTDEAVDMMLERWKEAADDET